MNIYSSCERASRVRGWEALENKIASSGTNVWALMGDFNCVRRSSEKEGVEGSEVVKGEKDEFNAFINCMELEDMPHNGWKFIWYRPNDTTRSRIDRVLVSKEWLDLWQGRSIYALDRDISDHCPLLVQDVSLIGDPNDLGSLIVGGGMEGYGD